MFDRSRYDWYPTVTYNGVTYSAAKVVNSDGSPRPPLAIPLKMFTVHYGGAGAWLDPGDTASELASIERNHAIPQKKPNEYNSASDSDALTWEWSGRFRAAHSAGENDWAWGHLAVLGLELPTEQQADKLIEGIRKARAQAVAAGYLAADHAVTPHQLMPGAATGCPGPLYTVKRWWDRIAAPLNSPQPPIPTIPGVPDMFHPIAPVRNSDTRVYPKVPVGPGEMIWGLNSSIPATAVAVAMNVVALGATADGFVTVWPGGPRTDTSVVNFKGDKNAYNGSMIVGVSNQSFGIYTSAPAHLIVDITGYWTA